MKSIVRIIFAFVMTFAVAACSKGSGEDDGNHSGNADTLFTKNVLVMEFVSFDCVYCPHVSDLLKEAADTKYPGRIDLISVHGRLNDVDPLEFSSYKQFQNYFYGVTGYPAVIIDQRDDLVSVGTFDAGGSAFQERINAKSVIGIALHSTITGENTVNVEVKISNKGAESADYRLAVAVLENDIPYKQANQVDGVLQWIDDYHHGHVLRAYLSSNYFGDAIGTLAKNGLYSKTFTYNIPGGYKKEKLSFVAYVLEAKGFSPRAAVNSRSANIGEGVDF